MAPLAACRHKLKEVKATDVSHGLGGAVLGAMISWVVNCTLVEVSLSPFFSAYFGSLFIVIGIVIAWRVRSTSQLISARRVPTLYGFAAFVCVCGALCIVLDEEWFSFSRWWKVPLYSAVGTSTCFAFTFSSLDLLNWVYSAGAAEAKALVESPEQVHVVLLASCVMGAVFGLIFGVMDVEDAPRHELRNALIHEERFCLPFGFVLGAVAGVWNVRVRAHLASRQRTEDFVHGPSPSDDEFFFVGGKSANLRCSS